MNLPARCTVFFMFTTYFLPVMIIACPSGAVYYTGGGYDICYWVPAGTGTTETQNANCEGDGGLLAFIPNIDAQNVVNGIISTNSITTAYIGYKRLGLSSTFVTWSGESITFSDWEPAGAYPQQPDGQDCVQMFNNHWHDVPCTDNRRAICSKTVVPETTPIATTEDTTTVTDAATTTTTVAGACGTAIRRTVYVMKGYTSNLSNNDTTEFKARSVIECGALCTQSEEQCISFEFELDDKCFLNSATTSSLEPTGTVPYYEKVIG